MTSDPLTDLWKIIVAANKVEHARLRDKATAAAHASFQAAQRRRVDERDTWVASIAKAEAEGTTSSRDSFFSRGYSVEYMKKRIAELEAEDQQAVQSWDQTVASAFATVMHDEHRTTVYEVLFAATPAGPGKLRMQSVAHVWELADEAMAELDARHELRLQWAIPHVRKLCALLQPELPWADLRDHVRDRVVRQALDAAREGLASVRPGVDRQIPGAALQQVASLVVEAKAAVAADDEMSDDAREVLVRVLGLVHDATLLYPTVGVRSIRDMLDGIAGLTIRDARVRSVLKRHAGTVAPVIAAAAALVTFAADSTTAYTNFVGELPWSNTRPPEVVMVCLPTYGELGPAVTVPNPVQAPSDAPDDSLPGTS